MDYILNLPLSTLPIPETPNGTMALWHYVYFTLSVSCLYIKHDATTVSKAPAGCYKIPPCVATSRSEILVIVWNQT